MKKLFILSTSLLLATSNLQAESIEQMAARMVADNEAVQIYGGKVGKLPALFFIEWAGGNVYGHYYHPAKGSQQTYQLEGTNPRNGVLNLKEFTQGHGGERKLTARIFLTKKVVKGKIIWSGMMHNTDGRKLPVSFSRGR